MYFNNFHNYWGFLAREMVSYQQRGARKKIGAEKIGELIRGPIWIRLWSLPESTWFTSTFFFLHLVDCFFFLFTNNELITYRIVINAAWARKVDINELRDSLGEIYRKHWDSKFKIAIISGYFTMKNSHNKWV